MIRPAKLAVFAVALTIPAAALAQSTGYGKQVWTHWVAAPKLRRRHSPITRPNPMPSVMRGYSSAWPPPTCRRAVLSTRSRSPEAARRGQTT
jgi:hypothetical protein